MSVKIIECPRDAMQGIGDFIPTELKIKYIKSLLKVGYYGLDVTSFVSPKHVPQMQDAEKILEAIADINHETKLIGLCVNEKSLERIKNFELDSWGFPMSLSENFQKRNTGKGKQAAFFILREIIKQAHQQKTKALIYASMAFGNPYDDPWDEKVLRTDIKKIADSGADIIMLSDTIGVGTKQSIEQVVSIAQEVLTDFPAIELGVHFHSTIDTWAEKVTAAYQMNITRFDAAIQGKGGCPMTNYALVGNIPTEKMLSFFQAQKKLDGINMLAFETAYNIALDIFGKYI